MAPHSTTYVRSPPPPPTLPHHQHYHTTTHAQNELRLVGKLRENLEKELGRVPTDKEVAEKSGLTVARLRFVDKCSKARYALGSIDADDAAVNGKSKVNKYAQAPLPWPWPWPWPWP